MTPEEYARLWYHPASDVPERVITDLASLISTAVEEEREACAKVAAGYIGTGNIVAAIRARGQR